MTVFALSAIEWGPPDDFDRIADEPFAARSAGWHHSPGGEIIFLDKAHAKLVVTLQGEVAQITLWRDSKESTGVPVLQLVVRTVDLVWFPRLVWLECSE